MVHLHTNPETSYPAYLTLKPEYCKEFRRLAIAQFRQDSYLAGLHNALRGGRDYELSKDTIFRILKGSRARARNVIAICEYFEAEVEDACVETAVDNGDPSQQSLSRLVQDVRAKIQFRFELPFEGTNQDQQGDWIRDNFIELNLIEVDFLPSEYPVSDPNKLLIDSKSLEDEYDRMGIRLLRGRRTNSRQVLEEHNNFFVYGEPGSGKTSYLKWLAMQCRDGVMLENLVPIFVEIRHLATGFHTNKLLDFVEKTFKHLGFSRGDVQKVLESGSAIFILDGLDETPSSEHGSVEMMVEQLLRDYTKCRFIFSSRLTSRFQSLSSLPKVIIDAFRAKSQIPKFVNQWFMQPGKQPAMAGAMLEKLRSRKYQEIRELARRPVLLKLLCFVFEVEGDFPTKRVEVFATGIDRMTRLTNHIETHISKAPKLQEHHIKSILRRVASYFFVDLQFRVLFSTREVERIIENHFADVYDVNRDEVAASTILNGIETSSGLLIRWAQNFCAFSHLTYQEFFAAENLVRTNSQTDVYNHLKDPRWQFVIGLVSELVSREERWDFFVGMKKAIDNYINIDKALINHLKTIQKIAQLSAKSINSQYPHTQSYIRAWYFSYSLEDTGKVNDINYQPRFFSLPDLACSTSIITSPILEGHELIYKAYHSFHQSEYSGSFISLIRKIQRFLTIHAQAINVHPQMHEALDGWLNLVRGEQAAFNSKDDWWLAKKEAWLSRIINLMNSLELPCTFSLTREQKTELRSYYNMTKLLSSCTNRSQLTPDKRAIIADSVLLLTGLSDENYPSVD
ncbi:MAG: NACHT domain-containing protein [Cyanobacteria bacterium P01_H01_bin.21]